MAAATWLPGASIRTAWLCRLTRTRCMWRIPAGPRTSTRSSLMGRATAGVCRHVFGPDNWVPDGMKVDVSGRVFCTGPGGVWVYERDGTRIGVIETPEVTANLAFGGPDLKILFLTSSTSIYTLRVTSPGQPHPWYSQYRRK